MFAVMVHRFDLVEPDPISIDDVEQAEARIYRAPGPSVEAAVIARSIAAGLESEQLEHLRMLADADGDVSTAAKSNPPFSPALFARTVDFVQAIIADAAENLDEAVEILRAVLESLYSQEERR